MPINTSLLIAAPMLQDAFVDKDGTPMAGGTVTCYQDNSRTTLKNWYYQSGLPGNYTYVRLPNPLTLSAAGTICDINGVDTIPFFYPYSELDQDTRQPYYITIVNYPKTNQITRANFPFLGSEENEAGQGSHENYIINNGFWRNAGTINATGVNGTAFMATICPSQHDGFKMPDITFFKNTGGGMDTITFTKFPLTISPILTDDITPEFYINHTCSNAFAGELQKAYFFPISLHVNTLASVPFSFTIQVQNLGGTAPGQNAITAYVFQDTGTGTTPPAPFLIGTVDANSSWQKYTFSSEFPSTAGLTLGQGGDDALYLVLQMPLNTACSINFTRPSIYLTNDVPMNSFETYDQVDAVINSPRTGDLRTSINGFYPFGWVPLNNGTIGNTGSIAATRANTDTWQLYNLLWTLSKPYDSGTSPNVTNVISPMFNPSGVVIAHGASAIADFTAGNVLLLTQTMGRVIMGTVPIPAIINGGWSFTATFSNSGGFILVSVPNAAGLYQGAPITFTSTGVLPGNIIANYVYYVTNLSGATFNLAVSYAGAIAGTPVVAFASAGSGTTGYLNTTGAPIGQYGHVQAQSEVGAHTHGIASPFNFTFNGGNLASGALLYPVLGSSNAGPIPFTLGTTPAAGDSTTTNTPNSAAMNIVQPGVFCNMFMKL